MRTIVVVLVLVSAWRPVSAQMLPMPAQPAPPQKRKSPALALTLEAICPIAGAGGFYAGATDQATAVAIISAVAGGVGAGSILWLVNLDRGGSGVVSQVSENAQQSAAITLLVTSALVYVLARASGLAVAWDATTPTP